MYAIVDGEGYAGQIRSFTTGDATEDEELKDEESEDQEDDNTVAVTLRFPDVAEDAYY